MEGRVSVWFVAATVAAAVVGIRPAAVTGAAGTAPQAPGEKRPSALRILFAGDLGWGESYQDEYERAGKGHILKQKGYDYSVERLRPLLESASVVVANLETPVSPVRSSPFTGDKDYIHYADPVETPAALLRHNIRNVGLANNHTRDLGEQGLVDTLHLLRAAGIEAFGAGLDDPGARRPWHRRFTVGKRAFSVYVCAAFEYREAEYDKKYGFYAKPDHPGVAPIDVAALARDVAGIRAADPQAFIVFFPHWGQNYKWADAEQAKIGHAAVDAGVDLVVGHGAHMMQQIERYRGKWILYSIGNFLFNSAGRYAKNNVDPFSLPAVLEARDIGDRLAITVDLYPIISDNQVTAFQPRPATDEEFARARDLVFAHSPDTRSWGAAVAPGGEPGRRALRLLVR